MHIAAANPAAVTADELDPALIERERAVYTEQAKASGKPPEIVAKMVEGRLRKEFYQQVVLLQQTFLGAGGDGKATVEQVLKGAEKTAGAPIKIAKFVRYALGEGIDKKDDDFAAEVAKAAASGEPQQARISIKALRAGRTGRFAPGCRGRVVLAAPERCCAGRSDQIEKADNPMSASASGLELSAPAARSFPARR